MMKNFNKFYVVLLAIVLMLSASSPPTAQSKEESKYSSSTDDRVTQLNEALTRLYSIIQELKTNSSKTHESIEALDKRVKSQVSEQSSILSSQIETMKTQLATELSSIQDIQKSLDVLKKDFDQEKLANQETSLLQQKFNQNIAYLMEEDAKKKVMLKYKVVKDEDGFALMQSIQDVNRLAVGIPDAKKCAEIGKWFIQYVPKRSVNQFFVMAGDKHAVCNLITGSGNWSTNFSNLTDYSHIVYE
jgi:exonuclease VII large subunit